MTPAAATIACREAGGCFKLGNLAFERHQGMNWNCFFSFTRSGICGMSRRGDRHSPGTRSACAQEPRREPGAGGHHGGPEPHDAPPTSKLRTSIDLPGPGELSGSP